MSRDLVVIRSNRTLFGSKVTVEAKEDSVAIFESFLGDREFYLNKGYTLSLNVRGKDWRRGDLLSMSELVGSVRDWSKIPWDWS